MGQKRGAMMQHVYEMGKEGKGEKHYDLVVYCHICVQVQRHGPRNEDLGQNIILELQF